MYKKIVTLLLAGALCVSLTGCGPLSGIKLMLKTAENVVDMADGVDKDKVDEAVSNVAEAIGENAPALIDGINESAHESVMSGSGDESFNASMEEMKNSGGEMEQEVKRNLDHLAVDSADEYNQTRKFVNDCSLESNVGKMVITAYSIIQSTNGPSLIYEVDFTNNDTLTDRSFFTFSDFVKVSQGGAILKDAYSNLNHEKFTMLQKGSSTHVVNSLTLRDTTSDVKFELFTSRNQPAGTYILKLQ